MINKKNNSFIVFDLDDTLYHEVDFLYSGYKHISVLLTPHIGKNIFDDMVSRYQAGENVFAWIESEYKASFPSINISYLLKHYQNHIPTLELSNDTKDFIQNLKKHNIPCGLITDGRSITQRNKIKALGLENFFDAIVISEEFGSEKPDLSNFKYFESKFPGRKFYYIADNTTKDFIAPSKLGWNIVCLKGKGYNIHFQNFEELPSQTLIINNLSDLII